jgi:hypothetical protein
VCATALGSIGATRQTPFFGRRIFALQRSSRKTLSRCPDSA